MATMHVTARLDADVVARLDQIAAAMTEATPGARMARSDALRAVLSDGLAVTEARYKLTPTEQKGAKPARKPSR